MARYDTRRRNNRDRIGVTFANIDAGCDHRPGRLIPQHYGDRSRCHIKVTPENSEAVIGSNFRLIELHRLRIVDSERLAPRSAVRDSQIIDIERLALRDLEGNDVVIPLDDFYGNRRR